jgi:hypothetical protein
VALKAIGNAGKKEDQSRRVRTHASNAAPGDSPSVISDKTSARRPQNRDACHHDRRKSNGAASPSPATGDLLNRTHTRNKSKSLGVPEAMATLATLAEAIHDHLKGTSGPQLGRETWPNHSRRRPRQPKLTAFRNFQLKGKSAEKPGRKGRRQT